MELNRDALKDLPCAIQGCELRFDSKFTIRASFVPDMVAGRQTIFCKRVPKGAGNRPGIVLWLRGSAVELLTFGDGDNDWSVAKTPRLLIKAGRDHEVYAVRDGSKARIYLDGIDRTDPTSEAAAGDVNCDADALIGIHFYGRPGQQFYGKIKALSMYNQRRL